MTDSIPHVTRRVGVVAGRLLLHVLLWAGIVLLVTAMGIRFLWGEISVNQMLLNLVSVEMDGGGGSLVWMGILGVGVLPLLIIVGIALWQHSRRRRYLREGEGTRRPPWVTRTVSTALVLAVVVGGTTAFSSAVGMGDYIKAANSEYDIGQYHVQPVVAGDEQKRNLVLIYLESGEATLADDQLFEKDAFASLKDATPESDGWQSIENLRQYRGGGWTMAGLVSTQCGIPLKGGAPTASSGSLNDLGDDVATYLGGATCLGDVLEQHGYTSTFLGGANAAFAAKKTFLGNHGYAEVKDLAHWRAAGEPATSFRSDWGLSDQRLLAHARTEIDALHANAEATGTPFNLSILTLDTHEPAHVYDYCPVDTANELTSVFACSMTEVAGLVDHMTEKGYLDDTAVVIMGDHLKHMNANDEFHEQLDDHPNRTIFNRIWIPGGSADGSDSVLRPGVDQLNLYPTLLEAAGLTLTARQAGLGVSAFAQEIPVGSAQALDPGPYGELLDSRSADFYAEAWTGADAAR